MLLLRERRRSIWTSPLLGEGTALRAWAKLECLPLFGPYEDAMSRKSRSLFHTRISSLTNIHRLLPSRLISKVVGMKLSLESKEGFIRHAGSLCLRIWNIQTDYVSSRERKNMG